MVFQEVGHIGQRGGREGDFTSVEVAIQDEFVFSFESTCECVICDHIAAKLLPIGIGNVHIMGE